MQRATPENKDFLTPEETIVPFVLSRRKFGAWLRKQNARPLIVMVGKRKMINRTAFEDYLCEHPELRRKI
jgi:hypothetical protein